MGLTLVTPPEAYPVTLAEAKAQCRVTHDDEDALITSLIKAATAHVEKQTGLSIMERTWKLTLDSFSDAIELPRGPVTSVESVEYVDEAGGGQTVDDVGYTVDLASKPQWVVLNSGYTWPATLSGINAVSITYVAGYATVPADLEDAKHAIMLLVGNWYQNREAAVVATVSSELALAVDSLLQPYRWVMA